MIEISNNSIATVQNLYLTPDEREYSTTRKNKAFVNLFQKEFNVKSPMTPSKFPILSHILAKILNRR